MNEEKYISIMRREMIPALGCTEPIAIAYASAKAREVLGCMPEHVDIRCSGNIVKNVKAVTVPNSGGMVGIGAAAVLGVLGGNAGAELEVLEGITEEQIRKAKELLKGDFFSCSLVKDVANLYVCAIVTAGEHSAEVTIINRHTLITKIVKDGEILFEDPEAEKIGVKPDEDWDVTISGILEFARTVDIEKIRDIVERQISCNTRIAEAGLSGGYGQAVGATILVSGAESVQTRAKAYAAAGSDARMGGCSLPVVINSGSGNQGMTVSLPVLQYAKAWGRPEESIFRALCVSNLVSVHLKHFIGSLSAFCGAVTAACGAGAAITFLAGGSYTQIGNTIINTLANVGGIVCDGAKASCAAKIASSVEAAILGYEMSMRGHVFQPGEGLVQNDIETTIRSIGYVGRIGMKETDLDILDIMLDKVRLGE